MAAVILHINSTCAKLLQAEAAEIETEVCRFDGLDSQLQLRLLVFISQPCTPSEQDVCSNTSKSETGKWAIEKFDQYLFDREFT